MSFNSKPNPGNPGEKKHMSASDMQGFIGAGGIPANATAEVVQKFVESMTETMKQTKITDAVLVPIDAAASNLNISALCLTMKLDDELLMYTLLLEATGPSELLARKVGVRSGHSHEVEIPTVTGDFFDDGTLGHIAAAVKASLKYTGPVRSVGEHVVHSELNVEDVQFAACARGHLRSAYNALNTERGIAMNNDAVVRLTEWSTNVFQCRTEHSTVHPIDINGNPGREDLAISLVMSDPQVGTSRNQAVAGSVVIGRSAGFIDLRYTGIVPGMVVVGPAGLPMQSTTTIQPRFVITNTQLETRGFNYQLQLLTLAMTTLFNRNKAWMAAYRPQYLTGNTSSKLRELNGLTHELGINIDTRTEDVQTILTTHCHPSMSYIIHVPDAGETTWFLQLLRAVANGDLEARADFINHADSLTNNHFSTLFNPNDRIVQMEEDRVLLGYYVDADGDKRDIREIDWLAMVNLVGASDMAMVEKYDQTFNPNYGSVEERLSKRVGILRHLFRDNLNIKGYATSLKITGHALESLWTAIDRCGVKPRTTNEYDYVTNTRGFAGFAEATMSDTFMNQFGQSNGNFYSQAFQPGWANRTYSY